jgi:hypothetical protein
MLHRELSHEDKAALAQIAKRVSRLEAELEVVEAAKAQKELDEAFLGCRPRLRPRARPARLE